VKVRIPTPLRSYTDQHGVVDADGRTVAEVLEDLDRRYPGIRFRVVDEQGRLRKHMKVFVAEESVRDLTTALEGIDEVVIMQALSGGAEDVEATGR
jgi:sulfur-carrier protein